MPKKLSQSRTVFKLKPKQAPHGLKAGSVSTVSTTFKIRRVPALELEVLNESIRQVKAFSMARRASDELSPELMSTPVSV